MAVAQQAARRSNGLLHTCVCCCLLPLIPHTCLPCQIHNHHGIAHNGCGCRSGLILIVILQTAIVRLAMVSMSWSSIIGMGMGQWGEKLFGQFQGARVDEQYTVPGWASKGSGWTRHLAPHASEARRTDFQNRRSPLTSRKWRSRSKTWAMSLLCLDCDFP